MFALEALQPTQWERFEEFASAFLVSEYPTLRSVGGTGDRGRDAELIRPPDDPSVVIQYSVAEDWETKLARTAKQVADEFQGASQLVYATNQKIGPKADSLKAKIRQKHNLFVDVRDRSWFVERYPLDASRAAAAEALVEDIARPILADRSLAERQAPALSSGEARAACLHLALQWRDDSREKGLTKLCLEALVRSVLRGTDARNRLSRPEIHERVAPLVSGTSRERSDLLTDSALKRLERRAIRRWASEDEFCLTHEERERIEGQLERVELAESELLEAIAWETARTHEAYGFAPPSNVLHLAKCVRTAIETVLLRQGEAFAAAVTAGDSVPGNLPDIEAAVRQSMSTFGIAAKAAEGELQMILESTTRLILTEPADPVQAFFRSFADAYTLFAFLRETPDVQSAVVKMFSVGEIWLDTSVLLPLLAETLVEDESRRRFTNVFKAARDCGLSLQITEGVLEEVERNTWNSLKYARQPDDWRGRIPFLASAFVLAGQPLGAFPGWMEQFRGAVRPSEDLSDYLDEEHGVRVGSLEQDAGSAPTDVRRAIQEIWDRAHERRRIGELEPETRARLVAHDVENYLGVIQRRHRETKTGLGYKTWWLTLDRTAYEIPGKLGEELGQQSPPSPVMSPDFMVSYLAVGPLRARLEREKEEKLPLSVADLGLSEELPRELIEEAQRLRAGLHGKDDRVIRRELRDTLDKHRRRIGPQARGGLARVGKELREELTNTG